MVNAPYLRVILGERRGGVGRKERSLRRAQQRRLDEVSQCSPSRFVLRPGACESSRRPSIRTRRFGGRGARGQKEELLGPELGQEAGPRVWVHRHRFAAFLEMAPELIQSPSFLAERAGRRVKTKGGKQRASEVFPRLRPWKAPVRCHNTLHPTLL